MIYLLQAIFLYFFCWYVMSKYKSQEVPFYIAFLANISVLSSFGLMFVIPYDIYYSKQGDQKVKGMLLQFWQIVFVIQFVLSFIILPFIQEYEDSGEFKMIQKAKQSIIINLKIYFVAIFIYLALLVFFLLKGSLKKQDIPDFTAAIVNCFGLTFTILLMGYGLVKIPKYCKQKSQGFSDLDNQFTKIGCIDFILEEMQIELEDQVKLLIVLKRKIQVLNDDNLLNYVDEIYELLDEDQIKDISKSFSSNDHIKYYQQIDKDVKKIKGSDKQSVYAHTRYLIQLNTVLQKKIKKHKRTVIQKEQMIKNLVQIQKDKKSMNVKKYFWYSLFVATTIISSFVLILEITNFVNQKHIYEIKDKNNLFQLNLATCTILIYMYLTVYVGLFNLKIDGFYSLYSNNQTDSASLMFYSINILRVSFPLCLNFLQIAKIRNCQMIRALGEMDNVPLFGTQYPLFFPIVLLMLVLLNLCNIYDKMLSCLGMNQFATFSNREQEEENKEKGKIIYNRYLNSIKSEKYFEKDIEMSAHNDSQETLQNSNFYT